jgi:hypothetical protein
LPSVTRLAAMPAEPPPFIGMREVVLQSAPEPVARSTETAAFRAETAPIQSQEVNDAAPEPRSAPGVKVAELAANILPTAVISARAPEPPDESTGATEASAAAALAPPVALALNSAVETPRPTVWMRLPAAKPPLQVKTKPKAKSKPKSRTKTARAKRAAFARKVVAQDPFRMIFANPRHRFDRPVTWPSKSSEGIFVQSH